MNEIINALEDTDNGIDELAIFKSTINTVIDRNVLMDYFRKLVDNSKYITFTSAMARKFINKNRPELELRLDFNAAYADAGLRPDTVHDDVYSINSKRAKFITEDIINPLNLTIARTLKYIMQQSWENIDVTDEDKEIILSLLKDKDIAILRRSVNQLYINNHQEFSQDDKYIYSVIYSVDFGSTVEIALHNDSCILKIII